MKKKIAKRLLCTGMPKSLKVSQHNIDEGETRNGAWCPIARALRDVYGLEDDNAVDVDGEDLCLTTPRKGGGSVTIKAPLSAAARTFIKRFDQGLPVRPLAIRLI